jgi:hypothetical protein
MNGVSKRDSGRRVERNGEAQNPMARRGGAKEKSDESRIKKDIAEHTKGERMEP